MMKPGKYQVSYTEVRQCIAVVNVTQDDIDRCKADEINTLKRCIPETTPHDTFYPDEDDIEILEVFDRPA
ncbi:MAG: hypothetical protein ACU0BF_01775 [Paracoccaceae bacterium]